MARLIRNSARCRRCGDHVVSKHRHDFVTCKCGKISVDGGLDYLRRVGEASSFEDTSKWELAGTLQEVEDERLPSLWGKK